VGDPSLRDRVFQGGNNEILPYHLIEGLGSFTRGGYFIGHWFALPQQKLKDQP
jgi:hypothetical protein